MDMRLLIAAFCLPAAAGMVSTGFGGTLMLLFRRGGRSLTGAAMCFSAGMMISVVCFELLPEAFAAASAYTVLAGAAAGTAAMLAAEAILRRNNKSSRPIGTGVLLCIGIAVHNLPEGLAIGGAMAVDMRYGLILMLLICLHNIPEGMAAAAPLCTGGLGTGKTLLFTALAGLPTGTGALIGAAAGSISGTYTALALSSAAGAMLYITCGELIPEAAKTDKGPRQILLLTAGAAAGMLLSVYL